MCWLCSKTNTLTDDYIYQMNTSFIVIIFTDMKEAEWMTLLLTSLRALFIVKEIDIDIYHGNVFRIKMDVLVNEFFI